MFLAKLILLSMIGVTAAASLSSEYTDFDPGKTDHEANSNIFRRKRELSNTCPAKTQKLRAVPKEKVVCDEPGEYATCAPCPMGYYKNKGAARKVCAQCGCGTGTPKEGATKCIKLCASGEKLQNDSLTAKRVCLKCEKGTYQPTQSLETTCIQCPTNWTTAKEGSKNSSDCFLNCSVGSQPNDAMTDCVLCPEGQYKAKAGPHPCNICPKNKTTLEDGALMKNECIARCDFGTQYNSTTRRCEDCQEGTFKPENSSRIRCTPCPEELVPNRKTGATKCVVPPCPICEPNGGLTQSDLSDQTTTACPVLACPACPDCQDCPTCPAVKPCPTCSPCPDIICPTTASTIQCPEVICPTTSPCPEVTTPTTTVCPDIKCPEPATCPACQTCPTPRPCPEVTCPTCPTKPDPTPCPDILCPTCPTTQKPTPCPETACPTCPTTPEPTPCPEVTCPACPTTPETTPCPQVTCPTSTPCPEATCPTATPCPTCPQCPTTTPCPVVTCPSPTPCPEITCPTVTCPTCPTTTECPKVTCPTTTACPACPVCPTTTPCPVVTTPQPTEPPSSPCNPPWQEFNGTCIIYIPTLMKWYDADKVCRVLGGHLAEVEGADKNEFLYNLFRWRGESTNRGPWIGIHYSDGYWKWNNSKKKALYMNWSIREPNFGEIGENCAHYVHHATREWNDAVCGGSDHSLPSLCEITDPNRFSCPVDTNPASSETRCPDGWCPYGGSCYLYVTTNLDWFQSESLCKTLGGYLAEVDSAEEDQFLFSMFNTPESNEYGPWIGAKFSGDRRLMWNNSTKEATYTNWNTGEPNWGYDGENCAHYYSLSDDGWNDAKCTGTYYFPSLCEMELSCKTSTLVPCPIPTEPPPITCHHPWTKFNDVCLIYIPTPLNWYDADKICGAVETWLNADICDNDINVVNYRNPFRCDRDVRSGGGHLAEVNEVEKDEFIFNLFKTKGDSTNRGPWIGMHYSDDYWKWYNSGKKASYMNWSIHEPNFGESGENCAHYVHHETQEWNDAVCGASVHSLPSICEISDPSDKTAMVTSCPGDIDLTSYNTQCPDGWCPFDGSCYLYIAHSLDWNQAATLCQALGGYLAEVTSADEDQFLFSMFDTPESTEYGPWIGARVYKDGSVIWSNSTEQASYTAWKAGEPNWGYDDDNCVHYHFLSGAGWNDASCTGTYYFPSLCEMKQIGE